jgi:hypothetical protein
MTLSLSLSKKVWIYMMSRRLYILSPALVALIITSHPIPVKATDDVKCGSLQPVGTIVETTCECSGFPGSYCQYYCLAFTYTPFCVQQSGEDDCDLPVLLIDFDPEYPCQLGFDQMDCCSDEYSSEPPCNLSPNPPNDVYVVCEDYCQHCP